MFEQETKALLESAKSLKNPEIHHYNNGTHLGASWYIKTVMPIFANDFACDGPVGIWKDIELNNEKVVRIESIAFDWNGNRLDGWATIWLHKDIDFIINDESSGKVSYKITDYNSGLNETGKHLLDWFCSNLLDQSKITHENVDKIKDVAAFLATFTGKTKSANKRKKIRVL